MDEELFIESENQSDDYMMSLFDHLSELRHRILVSLISVVISFSISLFFSKSFLNILKIPASNVIFIQISPGEAFIVTIKISLYLALYFASPVIFYQIMKFISPGLKPSEKKFVFPIVIVAFLLFSLGILFAYYAALPLALNFLLGFGTDVAENIISIEKYTSFVCATLLAMGVLFQVPLLMVFLAIVGMVSSKKLVKIWNYVIVTAFILGAVLTPSPDPFGQSIVAGAILILYALSVFVIKLIGR